MTVETEVAALTTAVDKLTTSVDVSKSTLDAKVATAASSITSAEAHKNSTNTLKTETGALKDLAVSAASSASTDAANAYQDLTAIAESKAVTATDVFVYDTSKDSDGGAWRNRTQGTSWYNEALNTSTRGATKKFPAVAVIVAEDHKVTIYDGDDPSMPMWMEFIGATNGTLHNAYLYALGNRFTTCITMKDGVCYIGTDQTGGSGTGFMSWHFIEDTAYNRSSTLSKHTKPIAQRNENENNMGYINLGIADTGIVNNTVNDIAVKVLPNAPIDPDTGLPVPTIAVATDGGVSVIKDDGSVVDLTVTNASQYNQSTFIEFFGEKIVFGMDAYSTGSRRTHIHDIPISDKTFDVNGDTDDELFSTDSLANLNVPKQLGGAQEQVRAFANGSLATSKGLTLVDRPNNSAVYITSSYNTGWMNGDIKLATLMDTTAETVSPTELISNGNFSTTDDWTFPEGDGSISNGQATITTTEAANKYIRQDLNGSLVVGKTYAITFNLVSETGTGLAYVRLAGVDVKSPGTFSTGVQTHYITYTSGSEEIRFMTYAQSGVSFTIDDVSITEVVADRSVNNNGLNINGNIVKSAVATGAELMGYGFGSSAFNNLKVPYDSDHASLGSYWTFMTWVKRDTTQGWDFLLSLDGASSIHGAGIRFDSDQSIAVCPVGGHADPTRAETNSTVAGNDLAWQMLAIVCDGQRTYFYRNGKLLETVNKAPSLSLPDSSYYFTVGAENEHSTGGPVDGRSKNMALLRLSASQATPEQIAKIYRDEKVLFEEGAKCTLYGDSDAVNALAYDEDTEMLHVGTTGGGDSNRGRSDFKGLQRVNNTTYGIAVALSAANGLVVSE